MPQKYYLFFILAYCFFLNLNVAVNAESTSKQNKTGINGSISLEKLIAKVKQGKSIDSHVIKGDDIMAVIQKTDQKIVINNSIITGGLQFNQLSESKITQQLLPSSWSEEQKQEFIQKSTKIISAYYCIKNAISIINCEIQINPKDFRSVMAERTFFLGKISFNGSTFNGNSYWNNAIFIDDCLFQETQFKGKSYFTDAFFYGITNFHNAFFGSHGAVFIKAHFLGRQTLFKNAQFRFASFRGSVFLGEADFSKTNYLEEAYFTDINFFENTDFNESNFSGAVFIRSIFHENALFQKVHMKMASFQSVVFKNIAKFNQANFIETTYFNNAQFKQLSDFSESQFQCTGINFKNVLFNGDTLFTKSRFHGPALFSKSKFSGNKVSFQETSFLDSLYFANTEIKSHEIDFNNIVIHGISSFQASYFLGDTNFSEANFIKKSDFSLTKFQSEADFYHVTFQSNALFVNTKFFGDAEFSKGIFYEHADFSESSFQQVTDFSGTTFRGNVDFSKCCFQSENLFKNVIFNKEAGFYETTFHGALDFFESIFHELAYFKYSQFYEVIKVKNAKFLGYVDFRNCLIARLDMYSHKSPTIIKNRMDFRNAWIGAAHFQDVVFEDDVDFSGVIFGESNSIHENMKRTQNAVVFRFVTFEGNASFIRSSFSCDLSLEMISAKGFVNYRDVQFFNEKDKPNQRFLLSYINVPNFYIEWSQVPDISRWVRTEDELIYSFADKEIFADSQAKAQKIHSDHSIEPISEVLQMFEKAFHNRLADKNDVIYLRQCLELEEIRASTKFTFYRLQKELEWYLWGMFTGYGTKIWWSISWCIFFQLLFSSIYWYSGTLIRTNSDIEDDHDHTFKQRLFDLPRLFLTEKKFIKIPKENLDRWINAMRFSFVILFKFGYRDTSISGKFFGIDYAVIVWIEWILGFFLVSYLAVTLSNTMPLVNRMISGVF